MKIKLKKKSSQYAQVHVEMLRNKTLSLKAKGLGAVLESYSNDFELSLRSIELNSSDGIKSIRSAIRELEKGFYLFRFQTRDKGGLFTTYWAFDSEKLDTEYLKNIIFELEKVEIITKNKILQRGIPNGNAVEDMPSAASRQTGSRQGTTYNNSTNQNKGDKNNLSENKRDNISAFRKRFITKNQNIPFTTIGIGWLPNTEFVINQDGFIINTVNQKILSREEALKVWTYLKEQNIQEVEH